jgi:hypothetical protein
MRSITAFAVSLSNLREFKTFIASGSTNVPPLKAAIGADNLTCSTIIFMPRGGRPLVTANLIPASCTFSIAAFVRAVIRFLLSNSVPSTSDKRSEIFFDAIRIQLRLALVFINTVRHSIAIAAHGNGVCSKFQVKKELTMTPLRTPGH